MIKIKLIRKFISLIVTPIYNIDFDICEVSDNTLLEEIELDADDKVITYNMNKNEKKSLDVNVLKENDLIIRKGKLFKIFNIITNYR